jgi:hypothetical protein
MLSTVYARHETSVDNPTTFQRDVVVYRDAAATQLLGRFPSHYSGKPRPYHDKVMLNCTRFALVWLPDLPTN